MNILVAGGGGFIGGHLIDALLADDHQVVCVDKIGLCPGHAMERHLSNPNFSFFQQDICDRTRLDALFATQSFQRVYHLAANSDIQKGGQEPSLDIHSTFDTTISLLLAMRKYGVKELFFASTSAVYGDKPELLSETTGGLRPVSYYGGAKLASEAFIAAFAAMDDLRATIIRFPNVVGPRLTHGVVYDFVGQLKKNPTQLTILGDGKQEKPYMDVSDLIGAIMAMRYEQGVDIINAGVETMTSVRRIADIICQEMGLSGVRYLFTGGPTGWKGDVPNYQYDLTKIHALGWRAKLDSDEAVRLAARDML